MNLKKFTFSALFMMSAISSSSWGASTTSERWADFGREVNVACLKTFVKEFKKWPSVTSLNARAIARVLCQDSRVFNDYAWAKDPQKFIGQQIDIRRHHSPLKIGLSGATPYQVSQILHGILAARHPGSSQIFTWTNNPKGFADWLKLPRGGRFPGVIHVRVNTDNPTQTTRDLESVRKILDATITRYIGEYDAFTLDFTEYTLVISSQANLRGHVHAPGEEILGDAISGDSIQWIELDCASLL